MLTAKVCEPPLPVSVIGCQSLRSSDHSPPYTTPVIPGGSLKLTVIVPPANTGCGSKDGKLAVVGSRPKACSMPSRMPSAS